MKKQFSAGFMPYEIGDTVKLKDKEEYFEIENIRFIQYLKECDAEFEVSLSCYGATVNGWTNAREIEKRII